MEPYDHHLYHRGQHRFGAGRNRGSVVAHLRRGCGAPQTDMSFLRALEGWPYAVLLADAGSHVADAQHGEAREEQQSGAAVVPSGMLWAGPAALAAC